MGSIFDTGIRPTIDQWLLDKSKEIRDYGDYWSASSAGYCMRKVIFERLGVPPVVEDARKQRVFSSGHIFHNWIQGITKEAGLSIAQELELQDEELMIRGHVDDLVLVTDTDSFNPHRLEKGKNLPAQHLILYDYKTAHSKWFEYAKDRPMSHYNRMQLGTYMYMLRREAVNPQHEFFVEADYDLPDHGWGLTSLSEARILKISKDDLRLYEMQLLWSGGLEKDVVGYWRTLNGYWKKKTIPKCTCADYENGFLATEKYNPYFYEGEPCSIKYYKEWKEKNGHSASN